MPFRNFLVLHNLHVHAEKKLMPCVSNFTALHHINIIPLQHSPYIMSAAVKLASVPDVKQTPISARDFSPYTNNGGYVANCFWCLYCDHLLLCWIIMSCDALLGWNVACHCINNHNWTVQPLRVQEKTFVLFEQIRVWAMVIPLTQGITPSYANCMFLHF